MSKPVDELAKAFAALKRAIEYAHRYGNHKGHHVVKDHPMPHAYTVVSRTGRPWKKHLKGLMAQ